MHSRFVLTVVEQIKLEAKEYLTLNQVMVMIESVVVLEVTYRVKVMAISLDLRLYEVLC